MLVKVPAIIGKFGTVRTETMETIPSSMLCSIGKEI
jgi:hypothetical protein